MNIAEFQSLSPQEVGDHLRQKDSVCLSFAFNGTRRWFQLEYDQKSSSLDDYIDAFSSQVIKICELLFEHGLQTLVLPVISPHVLEGRSQLYNLIATEALGRLFSHPQFLTLYEDYEVTPFIFGDYEKHLPTDVSEHLNAEYASYKKQKSDRYQRRIFWGICAHDSTETLVQTTLDFYDIYGRTPTRQDLIHHYYGDHIKNIDLHISSGKPKIFDIPLLLTGQEALYYTLAPSPYFNQRQLRSILYDHLYARNGPTSYESLNLSSRQQLRSYYQRHEDYILGVGSHLDEWGIWQPAGFRAEKPKEPRHNENLIPLFSLVERS